ncbi:hypothetical protein [Nocardia arthritidis]|uniref:hypothetical protein n=1 Tax=Nocardia arthritidis TaxID=228602 RepID=UPI000B33E557|nr:hypothetical protein [Nocardia arthritidis]
MGDDDLLARVVDAGDESGHMVRRAEVRGLFDDGAPVVRPFGLSRGLARASVRENHHQHGGRDRSASRSYLLLESGTSATDGWKAFHSSENYD